jgi:carbon-monoxide dehydrogenase medium subunit
MKEAVAALAAAGEDGKIIAGGQSLVPMMNFRLLNPSVLIDINRIPGMGDIQEQPDGGLKIGALTRHHALETSAVVKRLYPVMHAAMQQVAHLAIRNRGTIGGSITHADPAAELPMLMKLLDAQITLISSKGTRTVEADDFFLGALTVDVQENELVTEINLPPLPQGAGWAFEEVARRAGDFALAAVGVVLHVEQDKIVEARIGLMGVADTPARMNEAETILFNQSCDPATLDDVVRAVLQAIEPSTDLHASAEYRLHLTEILVRRALQSAWLRATGESNA